MKVKDIEKEIGTLSNPSKMPSYAWGIPIEYCNTGSKLAEIDGTICKKCYAGKGCYVFPVVKAMYEKRYQAIERIEWVDYMAELITQKYKKLDKSRLFHRWFDSGDVQSYSHLMKIFEVCELTPHIKHWLATKEYKIIDKIDEKDVPKNLCLRVSATRIDGAIPKFWKWTSGVHRDKKPIGRECPAYKQDGECGSCRACWNRNIKQVSYKEH
ncbi:MAG: hypothetical protein CM15mV98_140 [uncultured marine virus]|nr:MAG: hypothetical protein CM15mV98_140 [uncultured marine virus]